MCQSRQEFNTEKWITELVPCPSEPRDVGTAWRRDELRAWSVHFSVVLRVKSLAAFTTGSEHSISLAGDAACSGGPIDPNWLFPAQPAVRVRIWRTRNPTPASGECDQKSAAITAIFASFERTYNALFRRTAA
jgi:hypothetical protein